MRGSCLRQAARPTPRPGLGAARGPGGGTAGASAGSPAFACGPSAERGAEARRARHRRRGGSAGSEGGCRRGRGSPGRRAAADRSPTAPPARLARRCGGHRGRAPAAPPASSHRCGASPRRRYLLEEKKRNKTKIKPGQRGKKKFHKRLVIPRAAPLAPQEGKRSAALSESPHRGARPCSPPALEDAPPPCAAHRRRGCSPARRP